MSIVSGSRQALDKWLGREPSRPALRTPDWTPPRQRSGEVTFEVPTYVISPGECVDVTCAVVVPDGVETPLTATVWIPVHSGFTLDGGPLVVPVREGQIQVRVRAMAGSAGARSCLTVTAGPAKSRVDLATPTA